MPVTQRPSMELEVPYLERGEIVVGIDEVGRGALAGPITVGAVAVILPGTPPPGLDDSKRLRASVRERLVGPIYQWAAAVSTGSATAAEIDAWGLRLALAVAATRAIDALSVRPTVAIVDGSYNLLRSPTDVGFGVTAPPTLTAASLRCVTVVKGDQRCCTVAAAAIVAKVERDALMNQLHGELPQYEWSGNKGYGSPGHLAALRAHGPSSWHRVSWSLPAKV